MTQFVVPKFIEHKAKIVGPLTFHQFIFIGTAGAIAFVLYYTPLPFVLFFLGSAVIFAAAAAMAFGKINGRPIPGMLKSFVFFTLGPKIYLWKRKGATLPKFTKEKQTFKKVEKPKAPRVAALKKKSKLKDLFMQIETGNK